MEADFRRKALEFHEKAKGKIQIFPTVSIRNERDLALSYIPGSTPACEEILKDANNAYRYTGKANRLWIVCNGTAVLGLGHIDPLSALPVIEGKCLQLKVLGDINAIPVVIDAPTADEICSFIKMASPTAGGINIEDVKSPDSFDVVRKLRETLDIPIFCDDQQGSAVSALSAIHNSLKLLNRPLPEARIVVVGAGTAGLSAADLMLKAGARDIILVDKEGILTSEMPNLNHIQAELCARTNPRGIRGGLDEALTGADILIGYSRGGSITPDHIKKMSNKPVILALSLPDPEISYSDAMSAGAYIYASGQIDDCNTMLNLHAFPGIVRGAFDVRATKLTDGMLLSAAEALAHMIDRRSLMPDHICPRFFGSETTPRVAEAVGQAAIRDGVAKIRKPEGEIFQDTWFRLFGDIESI